MNTTADKLQGILDSKADIKDAIEAKGVTVGDATLAQYASKIGEISGGEEEDYHGDVIFIDYDGTVLYRYTKAEFLALEEMPANPAHEGLTSQGWNWSLSGAKTYVGKYGMLTIGHTYITDDQKTRLFITLDDPDWLSPTMAIYPYSATSFVIDWGDGSEPQALPSGSQSITHTFPSIGDYVIVITAANNGGNLGNSNDLRPLFYSTENYSAYTGILRKVYLGKLVYPSQSCFRDQKNFTAISSTRGIGSTSIYNHCGLKAFVMPLGQSAVGNNVFENSKLEVISFAEDFVFIGGYSFLSKTLIRRCEFPECDNKSSSGSMVANCLLLKSIVFTDGFVSISDCNGCASLEHVVLRGGLSTIGTSAFANCFSLYSITIGSGITSIGSNAFQNARILRFVHIKATTPPTLASNSFAGIVGLYKIYVPQGSLSAYQTATNWSAYASYMEEEPTT